MLLYACIKRSKFNMRIKQNKTKENYNKIYKFYYRNKVNTNNKDCDDGDSDNRTEYMLAYELWLFCLCFKSFLHIFGVSERERERKSCVRARTMCAV